jgi:hypothetical protein
MVWTLSCQNLCPQIVTLLGFMFHLNSKLITLYLCKFIMAKFINILVEWTIWLTCQTLCLVNFKPFYKLNILCYGCYSVDWTWDDST